MKNLFVLILVLTSSYAFSQVVVEQQQQTSPTKVVYVRKQAPAFTPHLRLNVHTLYAFDDDVDSYYSSSNYFYGTIKGGFEWGGSLEYMMMPSQSIELSYLRLDSNAPMTYYDFNANRDKTTTFDVASNYILIGSNRYFSMNPKIEPYAGLQAGMAVFDVKDQNSDKNGNSTKFAWGLKLGVNIWATEKVGLKMQAGLLSAVQSAGGGLYFGTGGAGAGVSTYSSFYQFNLGGGLTFNLGK
jgi:hypothetical protein